MSFLTLEGVTRRYGAVAALDSATLSVPRGSRTAILGPSGSGKTTLLRLVAGFDVPDCGRILMDGAVLADGPAAVPAHLRGIGLVAQEGALFPHLSVAENIGFGIPRREAGRVERVASLAAMVGLDAAMLRRQPDALSGGQQQRVALARALARRPALMLLDEPFSALDTGLRASTRQAVAELLRAEGVTTILVTHDQAEALAFADQVVVMRDGCLLQAGTPEDVYHRPRDSTVAQFLGPAILLPAWSARGVADCPLGMLRTRPDAPEGHATVMLREEQVLLEPTLPGTGIAIVERTEFGGGQTGVWLRLHADGTILALRVPPFQAPRAGEEVALRIIGEAHLLPA